MHHPHAKKIKELLENLGSQEDGLSLAEVAQRQQKYGSNELPEREQVSQATIFLRQFKNWFIYILLIAAAVSFVYDHRLDSYIVLAIIILNAGIGYVQESRAEHAIKALKSLIVPHAKVIREGTADSLLARELVPGDIITLSAGDRVPADARLVASRDLSTQESSLTGESFTVQKNTKTLPVETGLADRANMVWMGTLVTSGTAEAVVVDIGSNTAIGNIATSIDETKRTETHFRNKTNYLALQLGFIAIIAAVITFLIGFFVRKLEIVEVFIFSVATLVSSIPEGLPAVLAVVLAIGAFRMAKKKAIVRHLPIIEDLSVASIIITDKTGTLTQNTMTVRSLVTVESEYEVSGDGWESVGEFLLNNKPVDVAHHTVLHKLLQIATLCNSASVHKEGDGYEIIGDPTEASFVVVGEKAGLRKEALMQRLNQMDQLPFSQATRSQSVLVGKPDSEMFMIGSEESIVAESTHYLSEQGVKKLDADHVILLKNRLREMTQQAMRVVACAYRKVPSGTERLAPELAERLIFVGFMGIIDPVRPEAPDAIQAAHRAGIRVIMATGDHAETALAIGRNIGLFVGKDVERVYTESELEALSNEAFHKVLQTASVFARMTPAMKMKIITAFQDEGKIVAMIGDGVNDAPALKKANVGIAMGTIGTDVAREAADIVLQDDNFSTLIKAIQQGRLIFNNIRQTSFFMITTNVAEIITIIVSLMIGNVLPLTAIQILWINLITDGIPNLALAAEDHHEDLLANPPRSREERIMTREVLPFLVIVVMLMVTVTIGVFQVYLPFGVERARTAAFALMIFFQLFNALNMRSLERSLFKIGVFSNHFMTGALIISFLIQILIMVLPVTREAFGLAVLTFGEYVWFILIAATVVLCIEMYKAWMRFSKRMVATR